MSDNPIVFDFASIAAELRVLEGVEDFECGKCGGGGWECYGIGYHDPHFRLCDACHNPKGYPCP